LIVLDSSFLVAFYNARDAHHQAAASAMEQFLAGDWGTGLLLEYVFLEVMTVLLVRRDLATAVRAGGILLEARELEFLPCSDFFPETVERFSKQTVTQLSFANSAISAVARHRAEGKVLTFDEGFRKVRGLHVFPKREAN
jgi:predicted nucleic acid-binding protein